MSFFLVTAAALLVSLLVDREKTFSAVRVGFTRFVHILPAFLIMLVLVSVALSLVPERLIALALGEENRALAVLAASALGSISIMPGFIAFPLCGLLLNRGVPYMVLAAFSTTLMMVGVLTAPVEKAYFGLPVTIIRNLISFAIALAVALAVGIVFGEVGW